MYAADPVDADIVICEAGHWVFAGTGLEGGDTLRGLLGYEVDSVQGRGPVGVEIIAASPWVALTEPARRGVSHMAVYTAASGAQVFATGTIQWALGDWTTSTHRRCVPRRLSAAAQQATRNVLNRFVARRG